MEQEIIITVLAVLVTVQTVYISICLPIDLCSKKNRIYERALYRFIKKQCRYYRKKTTLETEFISFLFDKAQSFEPNEYNKRNIDRPYPFANRISDLITTFSGNLTCADKEILFCCVVQSVNKFLNDMSERKAQLRESINQNSEKKSPEPKATPGSQK